MYNNRFKRPNNFVKIGRQNDRFRRCILSLRNGQSQWPRDVHMLIIIEIFEINYFSLKSNKLFTFITLTISDLVKSHVNLTTAYELCWLEKIHTQCLNIF